MSFSVIVGGGGTGGGGGSSAWADITGKPSTFPPSTHAHPISDVTSLQAALDAKQASLVSATNIKTINGSSLLGSGDLVVTGELADADYGAFTVSGGTATLNESALADVVMEDDATTAAMSFVIDEDDLASDSATKVPTQQSVKAYVDAQAGSTTLDGLSNVTITTPSARDILMRNAGNTAWINGTIVVADIGDLEEISLGENEFLVGTAGDEEPKTPTEVLAILGINDKKATTITAFGYSDTVTLGDGANCTMIPDGMAGHNITAITIAVRTPGTGTGTIIVQVVRIRLGSALNICSTAPVIQPDEYRSTDGTPAVISASVDDLEVGDLIRIDVDGLTSVAPVGLFVGITAELQ